MNKYQANNILVTGAAGFIGSNFVHGVLGQQDDIYIYSLDKLSYAGDLNNLASLASNPAHQFIQQDICEQDKIGQLLEQHNIDTIVHFAAESHVDRSIIDPGIFVQNNIVGTFSLLEAARQYWLESKNFNEQHCRFHHISTDEVYGSLSNSAPAFTEEHPYKPNSPYSASKASADHLVRAYHQTYSLPITISNCSNNYGPRQHCEKLIPTIIKACMSQTSIPIYGDGQNIRDWLYVDDHCRAIWKIITNGTIGETYNIGGQTEINNISLANMICHIMDDLFPGKTSHEKLIEFVNDRPGHDWRYAMDISKMSHELNWKPRVTIREGLMTTCDYYLKALQV